MIKYCKEHRSSNQEKKPLLVEDRYICYQLRLVFAFAPLAATLVVRYICPNLVILVHCNALVSLTRLNVGGANVCLVGSPSAKLVSSPPPLAAQPAFSAVQPSFDFVHLRRTNNGKWRRRRNLGLFSFLLCCPLLLIASSRFCPFYFIFTDFVLMLFHLLLFFQLLKLLSSTATFTFKSVKCFDPNSQNTLFRLLVTA